jgi:hypothetical protein
MAFYGDLAYGPFTNWCRISSIKNTREPVSSAKGTSRGCRCPSNVTKRRYSSCSSFHLDFAHQKTSFQGWKNKENTRENHLENAAKNRKGGKYALKI